MRVLRVLLLRCLQTPNPGLLSCTLHTVLAVRQDQCFAHGSGGACVW
jgi:hypothetical protein